MKFSKNCFSMQFQWNSSFKVSFQFKSNDEKMASIKVKRIRENVQSSTEKGCPKVTHFNLLSSFRSLQSNAEFEFQSCPFFRLIFSSPPHFNTRWSKVWLTFEKIRFWTNFDQNAVKLHKTSSLHTQKHGNDRIS